LEGTGSTGHRKTTATAGLIRDRNAVVNADKEEGVFFICVNRRSSAADLLPGPAARDPLLAVANTTYNNVEFGKKSIGQQKFPRPVQVSAKLRF